MIRPNLSLKLVYLQSANIAGRNESAVLAKTVDSKLRVQSSKLKSGFILNTTWNLEPDSPELVEG